MTVKVTSETDADVCQGLQLFASQIPEFGDGFDIRSWLHWFNDNPFGKGMFVVAKHGDRVIGFYSIIPSQMWLKGSSVVGGKGEFLVVDPDYRNYEDGETGRKLPFSLVYRLNQAATAAGMDPLFAYATEAASICHMFAGAKALCLDLVHCCKQLSWPPMSELRQPRSFLGLLRNRAYALKSDLLGRGTNRRLELYPAAEVTFDDLPMDSQANYLFYPSKDMLAFRFVSTVDYVTSSSGKTASHPLILQIHPRSRTARLKVVPQREMQAGELLAMSSMLRQYLKQYSLKRITCRVLATETKQLKAFKQSGFTTNVREQHRIFLFSKDTKYLSELIKSRWAFNDAHTNYI